MLHIIVEDLRGYIALVTPQGHLTLSEIAFFRATMRTVIQDYHRIIIDLGGVYKIDAAGLGELLTTYAVAISAKVFIGLTNLTRHSHDLTVIAKLVTIFPIIDQETLSRETRPEGPSRGQAARSADGTAETEIYLPNESRLLSGETVAIKVLPAGRWCFGEVLQVSVDQIILSCNRALLRGTEVELSWGDNVAIAVVESCNAVGEKGYRAVLRERNGSLGNAVGDLDSAA